MPKYIQVTEWLKIDCLEWLEKEKQRLVKAGRESYIKNMYYPDRNTRYALFSEKPKDIVDNDKARYAFNKRRKN